MLKAVFFFKKYLSKRLFFLYIFGKPLNVLIFVF